MKVVAEAQKHLFSTVCQSLFKETSAHRVCFHISTTLAPYCDPEDPTKAVLVCCRAFCF